MHENFPDVMDTIRLSAIFSNMTTGRLGDVVRQAKKISQKERWP